MTSALLSILMSSAGAALLPSTVAAEGTGVELSRLPVGAQPSVAEAGFGQMLAEYQLRLEVKQAVMLPKPVSVQNNERPVVTKLLLASVAAAGAEEEVVVETTDEIADAPPVDPAAFSLIAPVIVQYNNTPQIAYTTDAEVATVAGFEGNPAAAATLPAPKEAFSAEAFPDLAPVLSGIPATGGEAQIAIMAPAAGIAKAVVEAAASPASENIPLPEVNLPHIPVASGSEVEVNSHEESILSDVKAELIPLVAPLVQVSAPRPEETTAVRPDPVTPLGARTPAAETKLPAVGAPAQGGDSGTRQENDAHRSGIYRPLGEVAADAAKPEANLTPAQPVDEDFSTLLMQKAAAPSPAGGVPAPNAPTPHAVDAQNNVPLIKLHAPVGVPVQEQIAVRIRQAKDDGVDSISIRLDPPSLGKLHIKLEIAPDGRAQVMVTADNPDTLDMLQRDARGLERALADAGVKADSGSMQFDLRQQPGQGASAGQFDFHQQHGGDAGQETKAGEQVSASIESTALPPVEGDYNIIASDGVDIRV